MVYAVAAKAIPIEGNKLEKQTLFAYASVADGWVESALCKKLGQSGKTRSFNMFPTCDRVTVLKNGGIRIEHLMTTCIGGWVPKWVFNNMFKSSLISVYASESVH